MPNPQGGLPWSDEAGLVRAVLTLPTGFFRYYVQWAAEQTDAPVMYHVGTALSLLAACVPPSIRATGVAGSGRRGIPLNLFCMLVGRQGIERKSYSIGLGTDLLAEVTKDRRREDPGSTEALVKNLAAHPQQLLVWSDMGDFLSKTKARAGGNYFELVKTKLLPIFDCEPVSVVKVKETYTCDNPHLSILGATNRPLLTLHTDPSDWETGFFSRFLIFYAHMERHNPLGPGVNTARLAAIAEKLTYFMRRAIHTPPDTWGPCVGVTPGALRVWSSYAWALSNFRPGDSAERSHGPKARSAPLAARIAALLEWGRGAGWPSETQVGQPWMIREDAMLLAVSIALRCFCGSMALCSSTAGSRDSKQRIAVLEAVGDDWTPLSDIVRRTEFRKRVVLEFLDTLFCENTIDRNLLHEGSDSLYRTTGNFSRTRGIFDGGLAHSELRDLYVQGNAWWDAEQARGGVRNAPNPFADAPPLDL